MIGAGGADSASARQDGIGVEPIPEEVIEEMRLCVRHGCDVARLPDKLAHTRQSSQNPARATASGLCSSVRCCASSAWSNRRAMSSPPANPLDTRLRALVGVPNTSSWALWRNGAHAPAQRSRVSQRL